jgi:hypothetical protein
VAVLLNFKYGGILNTAVFFKLKNCGYAVILNCNIAVYLNFKNGGTFKMNKMAVTQGV